MEMPLKIYLNKGNKSDSIVLDDVNQNHVKWLNTNKVRITMDLFANKVYVYYSTPTDPSYLSNLIYVSNGEENIKDVLDIIVAKMKANFRYAAR